LNREKAVSVFKEILTACSGIAPSIAIMPPNADRILSKGYQLHVRTRSTTLDRICIENISNKNNLSLKDEEGLLVIYSPKT
jgi:hypothetical protein